MTEKQEDALKSEKCDVDSKVQESEVKEQGELESDKSDVAEQKPSAEERIAELEARCKELEGEYLRKVADFDNYRKRMIREKQDAVTYANSKLLEDLLEILDNFDRAVLAGQDDSKKDEKFSSFVNGVGMIKSQMVSMLEDKYSLVYYPAKGELFDPNIHEAVAMNPSADVEEATVGEELQKGYKLKERVLRHSKVMVLMPETKKADSEEKSEKEKSSEKSKKNKK